ncbi:hypothetical protein FVQ98_14010 [Ottowia sp. GY511]|uniref:Tip attachment protein J domain-containing protein n=1 Tax=Ottowia flava TaxID=2675430 RepID=A0ABW4KU84_9BURK|nr:hypothetical protein [Ottowia sp. GY511]TXK26488.1 hypothetical protein FVQ98_14010 [Ottowia sp. GY511]
MLSVGADIGALDASIGLRWDANVSRGLVHMVHSHYQDAKPVTAAVASHWQDSAPIKRPGASHWQDAAPVRSSTESKWQDSVRLRAVVAARYQDGLPVRSAATSAWQDTGRIRAAVSARWQDASPLRHAADSHWQEMQRLRASVASRWQDGTGARRFIVEDGRDATPISHAFASHWQDARKPPPGRSWHTIPPEPPHLCYDPADLGKLQFGLDTSALGVLAFWCRDDGGEQPAQIVVPARRVYIVINDVDLRRVDGNLPLPAYTLAMSLDADSWTWQWSATLHKAAVPLLAPARSGEPVEVEVKVNGVPYRLLVESMRRSRQFAQTRIEVSGRGTAALLDAPYAATQQFGNPSGPRSAQQLMLDVLTLNGVSIGWAVDWGLTDWQVPAGTWSHQGSYITALNAIAQAAGGYLQPHATARTLRVLPRYPVAPWDWGTLAPDIELPMDPVSIEGVEWVKKPDYTRVYVSGEGATGVLARITRTGTAGDELAPMVTDALITHADAARQRGRAILSDTGAQAMVSLTLPVLPETGLILPGQFIRRTDGAEVLQGYVRGMSLAWDRPKMRQTLEVQTHG